MFDRGLEPDRDLMERRGTPHERTCVLVLGMHRSGTSALTRVISLLGAELPKTLFGMSKGNERGHWEPARLIALHDQMLKEIGSCWDDWRAIDLGTLADHKRRQLKQEIGRLVMEEYGAAPLLLVKDPRICRFAPFYIEILGDVGIEPRFVLPLRNPLAVTASLAKRDGMTTGFAALLWLRHVLDAEAATRTRPRAIVSYEALLADWRLVVGAVAAKTGLQWPRSPEIAEGDIAAFLSQELQHFAPSRRELFARKDILDWVKEAYRALLEIEEDATNEAALAVLDRVRAEFDAACTTVGAPMFDELAARESQAAEATAHQQRATDDLTLTLKLRTDDIESVRTELSARNQEIGGLKAELAGGKQEIATLRNSRDGRNAEISSLKSQLAEGESEQIARQTEISALSLELSDERRRGVTVAKEFEAERAGFREAVATSAREMGALTREAAEAAKRIQAIEADRDHDHAQINELARLRQAMLSSTSWRITRPMRGLKRLLTDAGYGRRIGREMVRAAVRRLPDPAKQKHRLKEWLARRNLAPHELLFYGSASDGSIGRQDLARTSNSHRRASTLSIASPVGLTSERKLGLHVKRMFEQAQGRPGLDLEYVPLMESKTDFSAALPKLIAFYLPQFHPIPENDAWWGRGFTEWTNVSKAVPQFLGHYQPHLPGELGFYDLRINEVQRRQIELAKSYGIYGFCYHHYWFGGRKLLERPLAQMLSDEQLDMPFCLCWANENWTRRWDGQEDEVLIAQRHSPDDDVAFLKDILPLLRDRRYITIGGRPLLLVYRVSLLPDAKATAARWRKVCREEGLADPYLVAAKSFEVTDPRPYGFDAAVEFPPHQAPASRLNEKLEIVNPSFAGNIYDYNDVVRHFNEFPAADFSLIKAVMPGWDNEPRRPGRGHSFVGSTPAVYASWLRTACDKTSAQVSARPDGPPFVFINAWNEWGEGAHLEPDRKYGYAYLHATANVLRDFVPISMGLAAAIKDSRDGFVKRSSTAIVLHLYYEDLMDEMAQFLSAVEDADVFVSVRRGISPNDLARLRARMPNARISAFRNRGRDVYPFLEALRFIHGQSYQICCKVHAKKSPSRRDGAQLRRSALHELLGSRDLVQGMYASFRDNPRLGLLAPRGSLLALKEPDRHMLNVQWLDRLLPKLGAGKLIGNYEHVFPAGSMFWFRVDALAPLLELGLQADDFEDELGQLDGTLAHAIERLFAVTAESRGYSVIESSA